MTKTRDYLYYDTAVSICTTCYRRVDAKIVFENDRVYMLKRCPEHGFERVLMADDIDYYRRCREVFIKPPEMPDHYNTPVKYGCPYDCGLCPDHEQHSCLSLIEICDACNLNCPICYAQSGTHRTTYRSLAHVESMLDAVVSNEIQPDIVQISGGEPTIHPDFFAVLDAAKRRPIKHLMVNTNGIHVIAPGRRRLRRTSRHLHAPSSSSTSSSIRSAATPSCNSAAPTSTASIREEGPRKSSTAWEYPPPSW